jgi:hypothetical protein
MELMYPMPTPQMPPFAPGASMLSRGLLQGGRGVANQLSSLPLQQGVMGQSGGLLSKLFGGAQGGGGGLTNILGMLQNAQKAIGVFQQVSPMVQQYAPFVKSLPALISMMRNSGSSEESEETEAVESSEGASKSTSKSKSSGKQGKKRKKTPKKIGVTNTKKTATTRSKKLKTQRKTKQAKEIVNGLPAPKLYI